MPDVLVSENPIAAFINRVIAALVTGGEPAAEALIAVEAPELEGPITGIFTNDVLQYLGDGIDSVLANAVYLIVNDIQTNSQNSALVKSVDVLSEARKAGDKYEIAKAESDTVAAYASLGKFDGA